MSELLETRAEVIRRSSVYPRTDTSPLKTERPRAVVVRSLIILYIYIQGD